MNFGFWGQFSIFKRYLLIHRNAMFGGKMLVYLQFFLGVTEWLFTSVGVRQSTCYSFHTSSPPHFRIALPCHAGLRKGGKVLPTCNYLAPHVCTKHPVNNNPFCQNFIDHRQWYYFILTRLKNLIFKSPPVLWHPPPF